VILPLLIVLALVSAALSGFFAWVAARAAAAEVESRRREDDYREQIEEKRLDQ